MRNGEFFHALFWLGVGIFTTRLSTRYSLGSFSDPGPGALPFGLGVIFILLALIFLVMSVRGRELQNKTRSVTTGIGWRRILPVTLVLILCALWFETLGYLTTVFLLVTVSMLLAAPRRWMLALFTGALSALGSFVVFDLWLKVQLPRGIFHL